MAAAQDGAGQKQCKDGGYYDGQWSGAVFHRSNHSANRLAARQVFHKFLTASCEKDERNRPGRARVSRARHTWGSYINVRWPGDRRCRQRWSELRHGGLGTPWLA